MADHPDQTTNFMRTNDEIVSEPRPSAEVMPQTRSLGDGRKPSVIEGEALGHARLHRSFENYDYLYGPWHMPSPETTADADQLAKFNARARTIRQCENNGQWRITEVGLVSGYVLGNNAYYDVPFFTGADLTAYGNYGATIGRLDTHETIGTGAAANCVAIGVQALDGEGKHVFGLAHEGVAVGQAPEDVNQLLDWLSANYSSAFAIFEFDDREREEVQAILANCEQRGIKCLAIERGNGDQFSVGQMTVCSEGVCIENSPETGGGRRLAATWVEAEVVLGQFGTTTAIVDASYFADISHHPTN